MAKKINFVFVIGLILLAIFIGNQLGLFSISFNNEEIFLSSYIFKGGLVSPIIHQGTQYQVVNDYISKIYGFAIFDGPIVLTESAKSSLLKNIDNENLNAKQRSNLTIFSNNLITLINKNSYSSSDLDTLQKELSYSKDTLCKLFKTPAYQASTSEAEIAIPFCNANPGDLFIKSGSNYKLNLNDFYIQRKIYSPCQFINNVSVCPAIQLISERIELSKIKLEISEKKGDLFIAAGDLGIAEVNAVDGKYDFAQYAYEIKHAESNPDFTDFGEPGFGYFVTTNNQAVALASDGKIEKSSWFNDLIYGLNKGQAYTDPIFLGAIAFVVLLLIILLRGR